MARPHHADDRFARLVLPEVDLLLRVARRIVPRPADAEDLVQDTLLRAFRSIDSFDGAHPRAWLITIMRNAHRNQHRRRRPVLLRARQVVEELASPAADEAFEPTFDESIERALGHLSVRHRRVVELVDVDGLSYADASLALAVPMGTIMSRLHRARRLMREELGRSPAAAAEEGDR